jgi:hypothetical protein
MKTMVDAALDDGGSTSFTLVFLYEAREVREISRRPDMNSSAVRERSLRDRIGEAASLLD